VGEGDTQQQPIAGEITSEQIETTTQPAEEVETQIETQEGEIETEFGSIVEPGKVKINTTEQYENLNNTIREAETDKQYEDLGFQKDSDTNAYENIEVDVSGLPVFNEVYFGTKFGDKQGKLKPNKKYHKLKSTSEEGISLYVPVGTRVFIDNLGVARPTKTERNKMSGISMSDTMFVADKPIVETEQVIQEEVVEEIYTLPEDPREAKKDFEILDNRDGSILELDEDGSNKWIVRNIKTDSFGTTSTKSAAQQFLNNTVNREGQTLDYGEGEPVLEEFRTQKQKEKPKKVKQTVPKPKKETKEEAPPTEIDKTIDELGAKGVDKINAKILRLNFGNAYAYIKNTLARGKGVINVMQEQLRSAPTTAVDYILGNENSTLFYRKLFLPLVKSYQQYADKFRQKQKIILEAQDSLLKESKGDRNKAKISGYKIAIAQKAKIHESNPDSKVTPPVVDLLNFTIKLGKAGKLNGVNNRTALELEKLRDEYLEDGVISFEKVYNSLTPTQKRVYNKLQSENKKLEPFAKRAATRRGMALEMLNDYSHRVVLATRNKEIDVLEEQSKEFSGETTRARNILERTEGVKAVSFDPFLSSLRGTQEVYLDFYMSPDISKVQQIAAGLVKKYENGNEGQVAATVGIEETIRELLRVTYLRSFVPSGYGTSIATEAKRI